MVEPSLRLKRGRSGDGGIIGGCQAVNGSEEGGDCVFYSTHSAVCHYSHADMSSSVRKQPGRPTDSRQAFSLAGAGQSLTNPGFSGWWCREAFGIFLKTNQSFVKEWLRSTV